MEKITQYKKRRSASWINLIILLLTCTAPPWQLSAQELVEHAVSNGATAVAGGNYTGYVSAGQLATYLYSNGTQIATQGIILNQIGSEVEFTFELNGTLSETQTLKSGSVQLKASNAVASGPPLANATVYLIDAETQEIYAQTTTDENGYFEFKNVNYKNYYFLVNTTQLPENPVLLSFESNIYVQEVVINGEVGVGGVSANVEITPANTCQPGQPDYKVWFRDFDGDGYGNANFWVGQCTQPVGYVLNNLDPDDNNPDITPGNQTVCTKVMVKKGWNIFSSTGVPLSPDVQNIFQPFIDRNSLVKIQDESGNSLENWGIFGGWINNMQDIAPTEGYKIKVTGIDSIEICGLPVGFPYPIPLSQGWNIMGYPQTIPINGLDIIQQLISRGTLIKVQDESGNSIENWGIFGGWINNIENFIPGKGYKIKLNSPDTLWVYSSYPKSSSVFAEKAATTHFNTDFEGNGLDFMNINMVQLPNLIQSGDEIAVFDDETCVGAVKISTENLNTGTISVATSASDKVGLKGFNEGNMFTLKLWSAANNLEYILEPVIISGTSVFTKNETTLVSLENFAITGTEGISVENSARISCYPNPFNENITIEISLEKGSDLQVDVFNQIGQKVKTIAEKRFLQPGIYKLFWNGTDAGNHAISPGIYHIRFEFDNKVEHQKIVYSK